MGGVSTVPCGKQLARWFALLLPVGLLGGAYISQYGFGLFPCEMCWWQRYPHFMALVPAVLAFAVPAGPARSAMVLLAAVLILTSGLIGAFHAGVEYGWWQGLTACSLPASDGDLLKSIMEAPLIRCDTAQWTLFGISLAGFNFLISTGGAWVIFWLQAFGKRNS